jgi:hypothetical protein
VLDLLHRLGDPLMRVLVTGSREFTDYTMICQALDRIYEGWAQARLAVIVDRAPFGYFDEFVLVHGACPRGADTYADMWGRRRINQGWNIRIERHPADWHLGRGAGIIRNQHMVNLGANLVVAFFKWQAGNRGTSHCVGAAMHAGIEVQEYWSSPRIETVELPEGSVS